MMIQSPNIRRAAEADENIWQSVHESFNAEENRIRDVYARREDGRRYSLFECGALFIIQQCERRILALLRRCGMKDLASATILELGCGDGYWLREFTKWGAQPQNITGIDLLPDRLSKARISCPPAVSLQCASAADLPFHKQSFDLVCQFTVFTSILDEGLRHRAAAEMMRVVKANGFIVWYDYHVNNPWNPDVRGVKRKEINRLFPDCHVDLGRITLAPPLVRILAPYSYLACYLLAKLPPLCTHYLGVIRKT